MPHKNHADYVAYHAAYRAARREKLRLGSREYRKAHPEIERRWRSQYIAENSDKIKDRKQKHYMRNREKYNALGRSNHLKRNFGITSEEKQAMIDAQNGMCAICGDPIDLRTGHTDHQHEPFRLREILCRLCNPGLGNFRDNPERLEKAAAYLRKHAAEKLVTQSQRIDDGITATGGVIPVAVSVS